MENRLRTASLTKNVAMNFVIQNPYALLMAFFLLWMCLGIFPLVSYETDSLEVILGCEIMYNEGWALPPLLCYEYRMQPLVPIVIVALKHMLPFLTCEQIYCLVAACCSVVFLFGSIEFVKHVTGNSKFKILIAAMFLPEIYAIAMYPNSAIPAAACFIWSLLFVCRKKYVAALLLMCIAPLFRVDVVVVYPVLFVLFLYEGNSILRSFTISLIYGIVIIVVCLTGFWLLKADVFSTFSGYDTWNNTIPLLYILKAIFGFYSISYFILLPIGLYAIIKRKYWKEIFLILFPIVLLHFIYRSMGCASKHYLYIAPFVIIAGVRAISDITDYLCNRKVLKCFSCITVLLLLTFSIRVFPYSRPWYEKDAAYTGGSVATVNAILPVGKLSLGVGAGHFIYTMDEYMLASGHLFYSLYINACKNSILEQRINQKKAIDTLSSGNILALCFGDRLFITSEYFAEGYRFTYNNNLYQDYTLFRDNKTFHIWRPDPNTYENTEEGIFNCLNTLSSKWDKNDWYVITYSPMSQHFFYNSNKFKKISETLYKYKSNRN